MEEKRIKHYSNKHEILLVGEGDFSFSLCLAKSFASATNIIATSLDSKESLRRKYSKCIEKLDELERLGCTILHEVDAHTMSEHHLLRGKLFDRIVFNFPHAGFVYSEHSSEQIKLHQELVRGFMKSGKRMLREDGEIHITHKTAHPFHNWEIQELGNECGLSLAEEVPFTISDYDGYSNKRGDGYRCDDEFPVGLCSTFKFHNSFFSI